MGSWSFYPTHTGAPIDGTISVQAALHDLRVWDLNGVPHGRYRYGPGTVSVSGHWTQPDGWYGRGESSAR